MIQALYVHLPFCQHICHYCDFAKMVAGKSIQARYVEALVREIQLLEEDLSEVKTIYFGGGTPSSLSLEHLDQIVVELAKKVDLSKVSEWTIEANPNDVTEPFLTWAKRVGINRLSIGAQSFSKRLLSILGRDHHADQIREAVRLAKAVGITNINIDLIYGIPTQTRSEFRSDLEEVLALDLPHISLYSLILEEKTILKHQINQGILTMPDEDLVADLAEEANAFFQEHGIHQYEFSNYAKEGHQSAHNLVYWHLQEYLGVGLAASSQVQETRFTNDTTLKGYLHHVSSKGNGGRIEEPCDLAMEAFLMGLRLNEGVDLDQYQIRFSKDPLTSYPALSKYLDKGLLEVVNRKIRFTDHGRMVSNVVLMELI